MSAHGEKRNDWPSSSELVARSTVTSVDRLQAQIELLQRRLDAAERERNACDAKMRELQEQNTNLIQLAVANQLLATGGDRDDVLAAIEEIVVNMIGSEEIAIFEVREDGRTLTLTRTRGVDRGSERISRAYERIHRAVATGQIIVRSALEGAGVDGGMTAAIPLKLDSSVIAVIAIFRLLDQKPALEQVDHELMELLSRQAAAALYCTNFRTTRPTIKPPRPR
jgi:hypothetical protein